MDVSLDLEPQRQRLRAMSDQLAELEEGRSLLDRGFVLHIEADDALWLCPEGADGADPAAAVGADAVDVADGDAAEPVAPSAELREVLLDTGAVSALWVDLQIAARDPSANLPDAAAAQVMEMVEELMERLDEVRAFQRTQGDRVLEWKDRIERIALGDDDEDGDGYERE